jgi:hypothetical protein
MTPRRNPEIVVAVLTQGGGWGWRSGLLAAQVIKAYVAKQRLRQTQLAKANGTVPGGAKQAEVAAVWHEGDAKNPDKTQAGHFAVSTDSTIKPVSTAPGVEAADKPTPAGDMEATGSHGGTAQPEADAATPAEPKSSDSQPNGQPVQQAPARKKTPGSSPPVAPPAVALPGRRP